MKKYISFVVILLALTQSLSANYADKMSLTITVSDLVEKPYSDTSPRSEDFSPVASKTPSPVATTPATPSIVRNFDLLTDLGDKHMPGMIAMLRSLDKRSIVHVACSDGEQIGVFREALEQSKLFSDYQFALTQHASRTRSLKHIVGSLKVHLKKVLSAPAPLITDGDPRHFMVPITAQEFHEITPFLYLCRYAQQEQLSSYELSDLTTTLAASHIVEEGTSTHNAVSMYDRLINLANAADFLGLPDCVTRGIVQHMVHEILADDERLQEALEPLYENLLQIVNCDVWTSDDVAAINEASAEQDAHIKEIVTLVDFPPGFNSNLQEIFIYELGRISHLAQAAINNFEFDTTNGYTYTLKEIITYTMNQSDINNTFIERCLFEIHGNRYPDSTRARKISCSIPTAVSSLYGLEMVPEDVREDIVELNLGKIDRTKIPFECARHIHLLPNLYTLDLSECSLKAIDLSCNPHLIGINLMNNKISHLEGLDKTTALLSLDLQNNMLESIDLSNLERLVFADLSNNQLRTVTGLNTLRHLDTFFANNNQLVILDVQGCEMLEMIDVSHNRLQTISGLQNMQNVHDIDVSNNQLQLLNLFNCSNVRILKARNNNLDEKTKKRLRQREIETLSLDGESE